MINVLEFDHLHEYKHAWNMSARACYYIFENLNRCLILYRYKLSDGFIWQRFGVTEPSKIKLDKISSDSLFIFHLDIYKESTEDLSKLLDFCLENNIDVYIPIKSNNSPVKDGYDYSHIDKIRETLERYETTRYDLTNISYNNSKEIEKSINEATKPIIRDINIKRLLD
jgi:hypothetical protein